MRNRRNAVIQLVILAALGAAVVVTSLLPRVPARREASAPAEVSVILREADTSLWSNVRLGMEQAAGELGAELRVLAPAGSNDGAAQLEMIRREAAGQTSVLVVAPADCAGLEEALAAAGAGCPIVSLESPLEGAALTVAPANAALGAALAQAVLGEAGDGFVLLLSASPGSAGVAARLEEARQALEAAEVKTRVGETDLSGAGLAGLLKQPDLSAVMAFEPALTEQAASVKDSLGLEVPLYGVGVTANGAAWLERGVISAAAAWSDFAVGYLAVEGALALSHGESVQMEQPPFFIVRGEDIYEPEYQKLLFPVTG